MGMIEFKNVYKAYKNKPVLSNISLTIHDDEFFVLIGSSAVSYTHLDVYKRQILCGKNTSQQIRFHINAG